MHSCSAHAGTHGTALPEVSVVCADIIIPLAAAFDRNREVAQVACTVLCCLLNRVDLPSGQVDRTEDLLASVRGVQRCSNMLCPVFDYSQEEHDPSVSTGTAQATATGATISIG